MVEPRCWRRMVLVLQLGGGTPQSVTCPTSVATGCTSRHSQRSCAGWHIANFAPSSQSITDPHPRAVSPRGIAPRWHFNSPHRVGIVNTTPHTSHFLTDSHAHAWLKCVCRAHITCHESFPCTHVFVLPLFDSSFLPILIFHDVVVADEVTLAPLPSARVSTSYEPNDHISEASEQ